MARISAQLAGGVNVCAFLDMIAHSEGTAGHGDDGYNMIVTGRDGKVELFSDYHTHPFAGGRPSKVINSKGLTSNAAGRYQFMLKDWAHYQAQLKLPDFSPLSQDLWAIQLIRERRALPLVQAGRFAEAVQCCSNLWASLPGAGYGQHENKLEVLRVAYLSAGGSLAA